MKEFVVIPANPDTVDHFLKSISDTIDSGEAFKVQVKRLSERSMSQNALLHIWVREYAAMRFKKPYKGVDKADEDNVKIIFKQACYQDARYDWLCKRVTNLDTNLFAVVLKSTSEYDKGEMFMFMEWVQAYAAQKGLLLESMGEFGRLKDETNL